MQVIIDSKLVSYVRSGKGKSILLVHGWGDTSSGLSNIHQELSKKFDVITPDLPGSGGSNPPDSAWTLDDFADFLTKFLKKIDVNTLEAVIGHSNGGAVAIKLVVGGKVSVEKLVLVSSAGIRTPKSLKLKSTLIGTKIGKALTLPLPSSAKDKLRRRLYKNIGSDMLVNENMSTTFKKIVSEDITEASKSVQIPTLLIYGDHDEATPVEYGLMFHQNIEGSTLEIIEGAGHFAHQTDSAKVLRLIQDFIC
jgi:pimeloyl-ACP methyl ester carboxylesterase